MLMMKVLINALEHIPDMRVLLLGRVLGGISTSLLFSAFESWMVSEHRKKGEYHEQSTRMREVRAPRIAAGG